MVYEPGGHPLLATTSLRRHLLSQMIPRSRLEGLDRTSIQQVMATAQALELGRADEAATHLAGLLRSHPDHPEILRLHAGVLGLRGHWADAIKAARAAIAKRPDDALYYNTLGSILGNAGDYDGAIDALRHACALQPGLPVSWFNLGVMLVRCVRHSEAAEALRRTLSLDPSHGTARALLGDMLRMQGDIPEASAEYRRVIAQDPGNGRAWWGLAELKTERLDEGDIDRMRLVLRDPRRNEFDLVTTGFALAKALDDQGRYVESLSALECANAVARRNHHWDRQAFSRGITAILGAFTTSGSIASQATLGDGNIFIVGLPRSGSTLVEQILASHSQVEASGELPDLPLVLAAESRRRGMSFPQWTPDATAADWQRLGEDYLQRTRHWRTGRRFLTDKLPGNWMYTGAIHAMLPAARIIVCRRDPLETCFSCYRHFLENNEYQRTYDDLVAYWRDFDRAALDWSRQYPDRVITHAYESLLSDPEQSIRALLERCGLPFEPACLDFHLTRRQVRSPSATQVTRPLRNDTARAADYGALLDPLRDALGLARPAP